MKMIILFLEEELHRVLAFLDKDKPHLNFSSNMKVHITKYRLIKRKILCHWRSQKS